MSIHRILKLSLKKGLTVITSAATILVLSGVALVPSGAQAQTTADIIAQLQAQISALQAQLLALQVGQPAPSTACTFTRSLFLGVVGEDVKCLQQYLNGAGYTVSASGAGSPGNETTYYGSRTQAAVAAWQAGNGVSPAVGYFGPISQAKYSSLIAAGPTPTSTTSPGPTIPGNVVVSLAPDNPAAKTVTLNAYGETMMSLRFAGTGKVQELSFKRQGPGDTNDFDGLAIYEGARRLTSQRTPSSSDGTVTFINLGVDVSGSKDLKLVADFSTNNNAGNVNSWQLTNVKLDSGTVTGFPLNSSNFTSAGANSGTINVDKTGSVGNPKVGQKNAQVSEFRITANTEAAWMRRVQILQGGTVKNTDITNLRLEVNGAQVATGNMTSDGYAVFDFGTPGYKIDKGDNKIFKMYADLAGKKDETIKFYVDVASDVYAVGDQFGLGMKPTVDSNFDDSSNTHSLTLQGGVLTIAFNGPNATNIGTKVTDQTMFRFSMTAANDIEVKKFRIGFCWDDDGNGAFNNITNDFDDVTDVKIIDEDTGQVVAGPTDGTGFTEASADGCADSAQGTYKQYTDAFDLKGGVTRNFKITADIDTGLNTTNNELAAGDVISVMIDGLGESDNVTSSGDVSVMKYAGTNTAVDDSDIVPNTDIIGNNMTLQASSLTVGLSSTPGDSTYVKGTKDANIVAFNFSAALASDLKVTDVTLTGYVDDDGGAPFAKIGSNSDSSLTTSGLVSAVKLYDGDTGALIDDTPNTNNLNNSTGTIIFNNLVWNIPAGTTKKLLVKADLSTNPTSGANDYFAFDIDATTDVTALDKSSQTVNAGSADPNGATNPTNVVTVSSGGSINLALAPSNPNKKSTYWGQNDALFTVYRYRATDEAFFIERLNIVTASGGGEVVASATANIDSIKLEYTNKAGSTLTALGALDSANGSVSFGFVGDQRPYVPKDSSVDVKVFANIKPKAGRSGTALSTLGSEVLFSLDVSNGQDDEFRAVGEGSGSVITNANISDSQKSKGNDHYVFRVYPEFIQDTLTASEPLGTKDVLKFTVKAHGASGSRLLFDDNASATIRFEIIASGAQTATDMTARLYDLTTNDQVASQTVSNAQTSLSGKRASITFDSWDKNVEIDAGSQKSFRVELGFTGFTDKSDFLQLVLNDGDANSIVRYVDGAKSGEDNTIDLGGTAAPGKNLGGIFRLLPMNGPIFVKQ
jgi:hypothetical protein